MRSNVKHKALGGLRRVAILLLVVWTVVSLVTLLIELVPGDPAVAVLGEQATAEQFAQFRQKHGLDRPPFFFWFPEDSNGKRHFRWYGVNNRYTDYWRGLLHGDLGLSFRNDRPVVGLIFERYPATLELALVALLVCAAVGIPAGVLAAHRRGSGADRAVGFFTLFGLAIPNFALGPLLILVFSIAIGLFPVSGRSGPLSFVLPAATMGVALAAILTRMVRGAMLEELSSDYVRTARAKGLPERAVLFRHAFRNALIPIITILGLQFGTLLAGAIVTETIFAWPGLGRLTVQAISARDYPLLQGCILVVAVSYVLVNLFTDVLYAVVDPRVRLQ